MTTETAKLDALVTQLPGAADALREELRRLPATLQVRARLTRLLAERAVDPFVDSRDFPCSAAVIERLEAEPTWALELPQADREFLRSACEHARFDGGKARVLTLLAAVLSLVWNGPWLLLFLGVTFVSPAALVLALPFLLATVHAVLVLKTVAWFGPAMTRAFRADRRRQLFGLGWWWLVGPMAAAIASIPGGSSFGLVVLAYAVPAMATAGCCFWLSRALAPDEVALTRLLLQRRGRKVK